MTEFANFYPVILRVDGKSLEGKRRRFWNKVGVVVRDPFHFQPRNLWKILYEHLFISLPCSLKYLTNQMKSDERKWNMYNKKFEGRIDFTTLIRRNTKWNKSVSFEGKKSRWKINRFILNEFETRGWRATSIVTEISILCSNTRAHTPSHGCDISRRRIPLRRASDFTSFHPPPL